MYYNLLSSLLPLGFMASYKGRPLGSIGDFGCISFHYTKNVICGEGGCISINRNVEAAKRAMVMWEKGTNRLILWPYTCTYAHIHTYTTYPNQTHVLQPHTHVHTYAQTHIYTDIHIISLCLCNAVQYYDVFVYVYAM